MVKYRHSLLPTSKIYIAYFYFIVINISGLTPLLAGAERTRLNVVEFLIKQDNILMGDKIDALELLGASFANDKDNYSLDLAYVFMKRGMELR